MALQELDREELMKRQYRYNDRLNLKLDLLRKFQLRNAVGDYAFARFIHREIAKPDVANAIGEEQVNAYNNLSNIHSAKNPGSFSESLRVLEIFSDFEIELIKLSEHGFIAKHLDALLEYLEWSNHNNQNLYPLRHFTYLFGVAVNAGISIYEFFELISEDRRFRAYAEYFYEPSLRGEIKEAMMNFDAPDWYRTTFIDGFDGGSIPEAAEALVTYMEKTGQ